MNARLLVLGAALLAAACVERLEGPGACPENCPDRLDVVDTLLLDVVASDTAFRGYVRPHDAFELLIADHPEVQSRALWRSGAIQTRYQFGSDPTQNPIARVDSLRLGISIVRRDTSADNLILQLYRLPKTLDSTTTFADVAPAFAGAPVRSLNLDTLLAQPVTRDSILNVDVRRDTVTGDYVRVDASTSTILLSLKLDSAHAPYVEADSGVVAFGVRAAADGPATVSVGTAEAGAAMALTWYVQVDSLGIRTVPRQPIALPVFDSFVFDPPLAPLDATLAVGGMPTARSILRVNLPPAIRDSAQVVRATLLLVPAQPAPGIASDSFLVVARRVLSDLGAKSVLAPSVSGDSSHAALAWVVPGSSDTVRIEVTPILRRWSADTAAPTTLMLQQSISPTVIAEGRSLSEIRFRPSSDPGFRPGLVITYVPRFRFGIP